MSLAKSVVGGTLLAWIANNPSHSASQAGDYVYNTLCVSLSHLRDSWTFSSRSRDFEKRLQALRSEISDEEQGSKASEITFNLAGSFLESLPLYLPEPELDVSPQGEVSFDWVRKAKQAVSAAISENGDVHYAWINGEESGHDSFAFTGVIDPILIQKVREMLG